MSKSKPKISVEKFLKGYPENIRELSEAVRKIMIKTVPGVAEAVFPGWKVIGYRVINGKKSHYFAFIYPTDKKVVLGFEYGFLMSNPDGMLTGEGETKQVRWINVTNKKDIKAKIFSHYISEAAMIAISRHDLIKK